MLFFSCSTPLLIIYVSRRGYCTARNVTEERPKASRVKKRLEKLNDNIKMESFAEWVSKQRHEHPELPLPQHPVWYVHFLSQLGLSYKYDRAASYFISAIDQEKLTDALDSVICLEEIGSADQIRGLECLHIFHRQCLDDWFSRSNEYCPLCHRRIVHSEKDRQSLASEPEEFAPPPPLLFVV